MEILSLKITQPSLTKIVEYHKNFVLVRTIVSDYPMEQNNLLSKRFSKQLSNIFLQDLKNSSNICLTNNYLLNASSIIL